MNVEPRNTSEDGFEELNRRPLKAVSIESVEAAFASALKGLTGVEYKVKLNNVDFNPDQSSWYRDMARMEFVVEKQIPNPFDTLKSE